ncbi:CBS domain-containing protein [Amycolatopsis samaneae]|uniref:CBS domain-containing protein n=1 Tax=Amycolatopsis samaneae TaxID=664691 RepID=A0ABW5GUA1_9PSEU
MRQTVSDVMTANPVTVTPRTPYKHIARLLAERRISAIPVVDGHGRPVGVVSEADLIARLRTGEDTRRPGPIAGGRARRDWDRAHALFARDLMTRPARTVTPGESVHATALRMARAGVRRLFVVDEGRLVGVVSRRDLLGTFCRPDREIHADIERDVLQRALWMAPGQATVTVEDGVVTLVGRLDSRGEAERAGLLCARVPGVLGVRNRLDFVWDDRGGTRLQSSTVDR